MDDEPLVDALRSSQARGFLGDRHDGQLAPDRAIESALDHAQAFVDALAPVTGDVVDLGSGGGVPGLVIAWHRLDLRITLVERRQSRADHLRRLVGRLGLEDRVTVDCLDARALPAAMADAVVARGFGPPQRTVAAAARLLRPGGRLIVSEPPRPDPARWPAALLGQASLRRFEQPDRRVFVATRDRPGFHVEHQPDVQR